MAASFLDASAAVKRYVQEQGQAWIIALMDPGEAHGLIIAQTSLIEVVAALCRKARSALPMQRISAEERDRMIAEFRLAAGHTFGIIQVTDDEYVRAGDLCRTHDLRAFDALQLACALKARDTLASINVQPIFVSADARLLAIAALEGLGTENPNAHD
jgi:uncharacterized protein